MPYKQVILVRSDLKLPKGKLAVQVAHASLEAATKAAADILAAWRAHGAKKIALKVANEEELLRFKREAGAQKLPCALICDAGKTVLEPGTITCLGIGPAHSERIDQLTGALKMI